MFMRTLMSWMPSLETQVSYFYIIYVNISRNNSLKKMCLRKWLQEQIGFTLYWL